MRGFFLLFLSAAIFILFLLIRIKIIGAKQQHKQRCSVKVTATIVDVKCRQERNEKGKREDYYIVSYEYAYMGQTYKKSYSSSISKEIGGTAEFYINPNNPNEIYISDHTADIILFAAIFGTIFLFVLAMFLKR